ncbi:hypothetical protein FKM82_010510 [Ascaphus truei]
MILPGPGGSCELTRLPLRLSSQDMSPKKLVSGEGKVMCYYRDGPLTYWLARNEIASCKLYFPKNKDVVFNLFDSGPQKSPLKSLGHQFNMKSLAPSTLFYPCSAVKAHALLPSNVFQHWRGITRCEF